MFQFRYACKADAATLATLQIEAKEVKARQLSDNVADRQDKIIGAQQGILSAFEKGAEGLVLSYNQKPICYMLYYTEDDTAHIEEFYATRCPEAKARHMRVGKTMFSKMMQINDHVNTVTVISSAYAENFYESLGFEETRISGRTMMQMKADRAQKWQTSQRHMYPAFQPLVA